MCSKVSVTDALLMGPIKFLYNSKLDYGNKHCRYNEGPRYTGAATGIPFRLSFFIPIACGQLITCLLNNHIWEYDLKFADTTLYF